MSNKYHISIRGTESPDHPQLGLHVNHAYAMTSFLKLLADDSGNESFDHPVCKQDVNHAHAMTS